MNIRELFKIMIEKEASDMFINVDSMPRARINGVVQIIGSESVSKEAMVKISDQLMQTEDNRKKYAANWDIDFIYEEEGVGRFRINVSKERENPSICARHVHTKVRTFEELNLPTELLYKFAEEASGLLILSGPAGSGKSTAIASLIETINQKNQKHIVTIEDPIEFLFEDKKSIINQRELGNDVYSYVAALRHVIQQSADIIYIGVIRDEETMKAAITATELGSFVVTTFHTINAVQAITRIVNFFPPYLHEEVRMQLSIILKGVISLRLLPRIDKPGRIPAYETMVVTPTIARLIRENKIKEIQNFIDEGELFGMQSFKKSLVNLVKGGIVNEETARTFAESKDEFNLEMKGVKRYQK